MAQLCDQIDGDRNEDAELLKAQGKEWCFDWFRTCMWNAFPV